MRDAAKVTTLPIDVLAPACDGTLTVHIAHTLTAQIFNRVVKRNFTIALCGTQTTTTVQCLTNQVSVVQVSTDPYAVQYEVHLNLPHLAK